MRQIKFRYWYANEKKMAYDIRMLFPMYSNHPIAMQFTGLHDSQGVDIYESDVVQFTYWWFDGNEAESLLTGTIIYDSACMSFALQGIKNKEWLRHVGGDSDTTAFAFFNFDEADFEVIGNIHESPDLIK